MSYTGHGSLRRDQVTYPDDHVQRQVAKVANLTPNSGELFEGLSGGGGCLQRSLEMLNWLEKAHN